jgi:hypothetical protein
LIHENQAHSVLDVSALIRATFMDKLFITELRSFYKNPAQIAHRLAEDWYADPGNKPKSGDRIYL